MKEHADNQKKDRNQSIASIQRKDKSSTGLSNFEDNRPEMAIMRKLQNMAGTPPASSPQKGNETGLPEPLKSGVETLSGHTMDDVKVHYDSDQPNQLNAHAYAQGTDIHVAPGQEQHLPHEAWHVVQQKQGRVQPTKQLKDKVNINDNEGLEKEADVMGAKASQMKEEATPKIDLKKYDSASSISQFVVQKADERFQDKGTFKNLDDQAKNYVSKDDLKNFQYENEAAAGLGKKIEETEGDVSWRSSVGSWFGDEGTWSKFLVAVDLYNKVKTIEEKQQQLYILKKEAHEWLKNKEEKVKKKETSNPENDQKKYETIQKFIALTTSNQPEIIAAYDSLLNKMSEFKEDIIGKRKDFEKLTKEYENIEQKELLFRATYPPAVNLHFAQEWNDLQVKKSEVKKDVEVKQETKTIGEYLTVKDPVLMFNVVDKVIGVKGGLGVNIADIEVDEKTTIKILLDSKGEYKSLHVSNGKLKAKIGDMEVELVNLNYESDILTADTASGKIKILEKEVNLIVTKARVDKTGFDYEKITGSLDTVDLEIVKLNNPELTYDKAKNAFDGAFDYDLNLENPFDQAAKSDGKFSFEWSPKEESKRNFKLDKANFEFGLLGQKLVTKDTSYDHKKKMLEAKNAELTLDLMFFKGKKFTGKNISVGKSYFDFENLSMESSIGEMPFGPLSITPKNYALFKDKSKGTGVKVDGIGKLNLPEGLNISASASLEGAVAIYFKEPTSPQVELTKGNADLEFANPLAELSKFLGDDWTNTRFELGASVPVFPGISAIFGLYLQLMANLPDKIKGSAVLNDKKLNLAIGTENKIGAEGGVFGGVQAGSQLLLALAALLRAAGKLDINTEVGYKKDVDLKPESNEKKGNVKNDDGFYYSLNGGLKVGAYLDLVATALYFFKKTFTLELKEWNLGEFEFSNKKNDKPNAGSNALFNDEDLKGKLDPAAVEKNPEIKDLSAEQLLNQKDNQRFSGKEKEEILNIIKEAEAGRAESFNSAKSQRESSKGDSGSLGAEEVFNNVPMADMLFFDKYVDKFVTWDAVLKYLNQLNDANGISIDDQKKKAIKNNLLPLKDVITIPDIFQKHFSELKGRIGSSYKSYSSSGLKEYMQYLEAKAKALEQVHTFKRDKLHSAFWGDENKIDANMRSWSIIGNSPLTDMIISYTALYQYLEGVKDTLRINEKDARYKMAEKALTEMNKEHQKQLEIKRSKGIKATPS